MKPEKEIESFCPVSQEDWRLWLMNHHQEKESVWLVYYKKKSGFPSITYSDAVDEALCFGWIDSTKKTIDNDRFMQFFCKRKPKSVWSKVNKTKVQRLMEENRMTEMGYESIQTAQKNGSWFVLDDVDELKIPADLMKAFKTRAGAKSYFLSLSKSGRKSILQWLVLAKREETRKKRIKEIADLAALKQKPKQFR